MGHGKSNGMPYREDKGRTMGRTAAQGTRCYPKQGIRYKKMCFVCDTAVKQRWFDREGGRISERCTLILNPNDMMNCYVVLPSGKLERAVRASATENAYIHWTKYDMDYYINHENAAQRLESRLKISGDWTITKKLSNYQSGRGTKQRSDQQNQSQEGSHRERNPKQSEGRTGKGDRISRGRS